MHFDERIREKMMRHACNYGMSNARLKKLLEGSWEELERDVNQNTKKGETEMLTSRKVVGVKFWSDRNDGEQSPKTYTYWTTLDLEVGDMVVVKVSMVPKVVEVVEVNLSRSVTSKADKWILAKVDMDSTAKAIKREERITSLVAEMRERARAVAEMKALELLASDDDVLSKMIKKYRKMIK